MYGTLGTHATADGSQAWSWSNAKKWWNSSAFSIKFPSQNYILSEFNKNRECLLLICSPAPWAALRLVGLKSLIFKISSLLEVVKVLKDHGRPTHLGRSRLKYLLCFPDFYHFFLVMCVLVPPKHFGTLIYYISQNLCPSRKVKLLGGTGLGLQWCCEASLVSLVLSEVVVANRTGGNWWFLKVVGHTNSGSMRTVQFL